jgi:hypothetical protein
MRLVQKYAFAVATVASIEESFGAGRVGPAESPSGYGAEGLTASVILHGLVLAALFVAGQQGLQASRGGATFIPVEVRMAGNGRPAPLPQSSLPQRTARDNAADPAPLGEASAALQVPSDAPEGDALSAKLQALAKLRQPDMSAHGDSSGGAMPAEDDGAAFGFDTMYQVRDFLRAQVMRRWHLDVASLGHEHVSVPIRVEITSRGEVIKAEILSKEHAAIDPAYDEIAASARNAVLLSSPFAMPKGHYQDEMEVVLYLDPSDALR